MIEWVLVYILTWPAILLILLVALFSEHNDSHKFMAFCTLLAGVITVFYLSIPMSVVKWIAIAYIPLGLIWSFWRWRVYCNHQVERANNSTTGAYDKSWLRVQMDIKENIDKLISWVLGWPLSLIERIFGDVMEFTKIVITEWFKKVYDRISDNAIDKYTGK